MWTTQPPIANRLNVLLRTPFSATSHEVFRLNVVPIDGDKGIERSLYIDIHPTTPMSSLSQAVCRKLGDKFIIGDFFRSDLEILPLENTPTRNQLQQENLAGLQTQVQHRHELQVGRVAKFFNHRPEGEDEIHLLVWLPSEKGKFRLISSNI